MASEEATGAIGGAAQGAAIGSIVPGIGTAIGAGVGGVVGMIGGKGARKGREAAEAAARARQIEVGKYYNYQAGLADQISKAMNDPIALQAMTNAMGTQERNLARQEQLIAAVDPALKEAASQALALLQGKEASSLAPLRAERQRQRQTLLNTLRAQLGPGAENSSAGQQALNRFDAETSNVMASQQQSSLSALMGTTERTGAGINLGNEAGTLVNLANAKFGRLSQGVGMQSDLMRGAFQAKTGVAGTEFVGDSMRGAFLQNTAGQVMGAGASLAGSYLSGLGGLGGSSGGAADAGSNVSGSGYGRLNLQRE